MVTCVVDIIYILYIVQMTASQNIFAAYALMFWNAKSAKDWKCLMSVVFTPQIKINWVENDWALRIRLEKILDANSDNVSNIRLSLNKALKPDNTMVSVEWCRWVASINTSKRICHKSRVTFSHTTSRINLYCCCIEVEAKINPIWRQLARLIGTIPDCEMTS